MRFFIINKLCYASSCKFLTGISCNWTAYIARACLYFAIYAVQSKACLYFAIYAVQSKAYLYFAIYAVQSKACLYFEISAVQLPDIDFN